MGVIHVAHFDICFEQINIFYIFFLFWHFLSTLPSTQTIKVIDLIFFSMRGLENLGYNHAFQPYTYSQRRFSKGGGAGNAPPVYTWIQTPQPF